MTPRVSIIIVNWNGRKHLPDCLDSLANQTFRAFEVILVDNSSTDGSVPFVRTTYPWVRLACLDRNTGFSGGNNQGLMLAKGEYIVTLNNDTCAAENWLEELLKVADANPPAGMVGCRICSFFEPDRIDSLGMGICADGMSRGMHRNERWSELSLPVTFEILFPSACAALYRAEMVREIGFFDEDFFAYAEDSDLGLRARLAGWDALLASNAIVYHKYSQSSGNLSPLKVYLVERNHYWVALKNFSLPAILALPWFTLLRYFVQARIILERKGTGAEFLAGDAKQETIKGLFKALRDSAIGAPRMLSKRSQIKQLKRLSPADFNRLLQRHRISFHELLDNKQTP